MSSTLVAASRSSLPHAVGSTRATPVGRPSSLLVYRHQHAPTPGSGGCAENRRCHHRHQHENYQHGRDPLGRRWAAGSILGRRNISSGHAAHAKKGGAGGPPAAGKGAAGSRVTRAEDFSKWYLQVIADADLAESSAVRGCMVIKPPGFALWERVRDDLDARIKATGHVNAYFPLLIPQSFLTREAEHVDGFATECAVVTHHRLRTVRDEETGATRVEADPDAALTEPLVVRPTSETMIWSTYAKWIDSVRDLPILVNQWANVVRWEMRTRPFLRTSEFLWQEGHTAHATEAEADEEAYKMLDVYHDLCAEMLAIPTVRGTKSPSERFAGAAETLTIEALMQNGWALQSGTSHILGQRFAKAFDVRFQDHDGVRKHVWSTSWGVSTRIVGALIMTHSDDTGLVLPPRVAPVQVVIVPLPPPKSRKAAKDDSSSDVGTNEQADTTMPTAAEIDAAASSLCKALEEAGVRAKVDDRSGMKPGKKYFEWERRGVPLRLELGAREIMSGAVVAAIRHSATKITVDAPTPDTAAAAIKVELDNIQADLLSRARQRLADSTYRVDKYEEMKAALDAGNAGFFEVPWHCDAANEAAIKEDCKATIRCYPFERQELARGKTCFYSGREATHIALFARAY